MQFDRTKCLAALKRCRCLNQLESCLEEGLRQLKIKCIVLFGRLRGCGNSPRDLYVMLNERRIEDTRRKMPWQLGNIEYLLAMEEIYARKKRRGVWSARQIKMHEREVAIKFKFCSLKVNAYSSTIEKGRRNLCVCI